MEVSHQSVNDKGKRERLPVIGCGYFAFSTFTR